VGHDRFFLEVNNQQADLVLSQDFEVREQTRILRFKVVEKPKQTKVEGGRELGTRNLLNEAKI
jgi:hypothetical protein